ncbi:YajD family HNH nuclease [Wohlfahrtiimonas chitiniclastica]|uniref:Putative HNH nuclease YajD n=1 Tax=Wohlfahrtiimonas chitiniclastica SH04 TaxID=1261130 RepID=L8XZC0_9GAMM|nr:YajD family HNH nuclease [Wohlfahrtiimonas chitiniclastica]ELV08174.1 Putative protein YajD [Wohlfahrtiimonas chitiniclastica SH04]KZS23098.1 hypothetical protein BMY_0941 [Wohlfahrtiimonas chitiniclastica]KZX37546.1 HNH endonuclease [Wohlfahrtiimonas chitiniclastica]MDC7252268.1 HNH endonuclease [Wohlfahrtiimonas chitiniclastica]OYQ70070.1 HNH endonuclease [Wohlfahrtiimonas chitiniclastica]
MVTMSKSRLDEIVAKARKEADQRAAGYRERALKMYSWICGRCAREFDRSNLFELTVHHRDHDHDNNPPDGSNWELLCLYCHDNEHQRQEEALRAKYHVSEDEKVEVKHNPFAGLADMLKK